MSLFDKPPLPPAMEGFIEDVELSNTNTLTYNRVYSKIGQTNLLAADPAVVHFGGFQLGQVYRQTLRIRNISTTGTRIHIIPPTTPFFKATCNDKKGLLAPGLADLIEVEFCPQQYRYYYDCVRIHSEDENMLIPLHAYPIMNETKFPKRVDFGKVALGDQVTKKFKMECKVPIEFEFEISEVKPNRAFTVEPARGIVPAHGHVTIAITFEPLSLTTEEGVIQVKVAEFGAEPVTCTLTGSARPGVAKERVLVKAGMAPGLLPQLTMEQLDGTQLFKTSKRTMATNKGGGNARGGAGGGDAFTTMIMDERRQMASMRDCRQTGPINVVLPKLANPPAEVEVGGIYLPEGTLTSNAEVAYVLNQEPGKLRIKDVRETIKVKKVEAEEQREALEAIMAEGLHSGVHPLERPEVPPHIKAALFRQLLAAAEEEERRVALGSGVYIGEEVLGGEEIAEAQRLREGQHRAHMANTELAAAHRLEAVLEPAGALHLPAGVASAMAQGAHGSGEGAVLSGGLGDGGGSSGGAGGGEGMLASAAFAGVASPGPEEPGYAPAWRLIESNTLKKRSEALLRLQRVAFRIIYARRQKKALTRIRDVLGQLGWDKQRLAEEAANPVLLVSEADRPGTAPTKHLKPDNVRTRPLPLYRDVNFTFHGPLPPSDYTDFDELGPMVPRVPLEYRLLGYDDEAFPGLTTYAPPLAEQPLESGAAEERGPGEGPQPSGALLPGGPCDVRNLPPMPDAMKQPPFTTLEVGNRYTEDKVVALPEPSWGMDLAYAVQPALYAATAHDSTTHEVAASGSVRALRGAPPSLSARWLPRKDAWGVQLSAEVVPQLLAGPDPLDLLRDSLEDADKPAIRIAVPSDEEIARYLPPEMPNVLLHRPIVGHGLPLQQPTNASSAAAAGPLTISIPGGPNTSQPGAPVTPTAATPSGAPARSPSPTPKGQPQASSPGVPPPAAAAAAAGPRPGSPGLAPDSRPYELMRQKRQNEVDAAKRVNRFAAMQALDTRLSTYNGTLKLPCHFALDIWSGDAKPGRGGGLPAQGSRGRS